MHHKVLYAATKAFISSFGASLAAEVRELGIDVLVFHPSPVATRFYDKVRPVSRIVFAPMQSVTRLPQPAEQRGVLWMCKPWALPALPCCKRLTVGHVVIAGAQAGHARVLQGDQACTT
jgi:NAD(P)-dependent dehydrogenase (short-subunit alcohol dehydrogenase family)